MSPALDQLSADGQASSPHQPTNTLAANNDTRRKGPPRRTRAQLERKRIQDRESQRNVRERTKKYIASLEEKLARLESDTCVADLVRENEELQQRVRMLEAKVQSIIDVATSQDNNSSNKNNNDAIDGPARKKRRLPSNKQPREIQSEKEQTDDDPPPEYCTTSRPNPNHGLPSHEKDITQESHRTDSAHDLANDELHHLNQSSQGCEVLIDPPSVNSGDTIEIMVDANNDFGNCFLDTSTGDFEASRDFVPAI
ncbi:hypothetical protein AYO20_01316 [Fonsecaea nubica]|uniref:BZIP domain-containing protein n=1 Tax=Fonsecaea nubica TaxID=856822 RepID=A0A178DCF2_9EURO|nr:hypothetical protein AYO20_01316 [Fonsecaea nubica]OAL39446.1 hypothetical protein AYO20_01316 [Fonsecaea nubica]